MADEKDEKGELEGDFKKLIENLGPTQESNFLRKVVIYLASHGFAGAMPARASFGAPVQEFIENRVSKLEDEAEKLREEIKALRRPLSDEIEPLKTEISRLKTDYSTVLSLLNEGNLVSPELAIPRLVSASIYIRAENIQLGEDWVGRRIKQALGAVCTAVGFEFYDEEPPQQGSWFQRFRFKTINLLSSAEVQERINKLERAFELKMIDGAQSKIDLDLSKATVELTRALQHVEIGIISVGSLFVVKNKTNGVSKIAILSLTQEQMNLVRQNPAMQTDPEFFHRMLGTASREMTLVPVVRTEEAADAAEPLPGDSQADVKDRSRKSRKDPNA